jgi:hypothetical protein
MLVTCRFSSRFSSEICERIGAETPECQSQKANVLLSFASCPCGPGSAFFSASP